MGLFCLPDKALPECSVEDLVHAAEENIALWRKHRTCTYLLGFAAEMLEQAAEKAKSLEL